MDRPGCAVTFPHRDPDRWTPPFAVEAAEHRGDERGFRLEVRGAFAAEPPPPLQPPSAFPRTTGEVITVMSLFHRAEIARMAGWRDRIDRTTNWAITVVAATLSVALSTPSAHHGVLLFAMALISLLLTIEARRYRFFDIFRARVRLLECDDLAQAFAPRPDHTPDWLQTLGADLRAPQFRTTFRDALGRRLRRNQSCCRSPRLAAPALAPRFREHLHAIR